MSFIHMVSFKFGTDASENDKQSFIDSLDSLKTIPGVLRLHHGPNVSTRSEYQYGLLVEFTDQEAERAYQPHATHLVVVGHYKKVAPNANDILASIDVNDYFDAAK